ncbi:MAG: peptidoglycan editing factor PgeF [Chloroflexota bacterium]
MQQKQTPDGFPYLQFESLAPNSRLAHAIFTRQGGVSPDPFNSLNLSVSVPDSKENVYANRRIAYGIFGRDTETAVHAHLVHGNDVVRVTSTNNGTWSKGDGLITNEVGCALTMNFADCGSVFLYDPDQHAIGLGHAGWKGAVNDLPGAMVQAMVATFGSQPANLIAALGPSIGACCYEVDEPVISQVRAACVEPETLLVDGPETKKNGRPYFDLPEANRRNLQRAGVGQIEMPGLCTGCRTDLFFSHRVERGKTGRFGSMFILNA